VWAKPGRELPYFSYPASHNRANLMKFWERGEPAPIAFWIGHHPAVSVGAQAKLDYPESHWSAAGALVGEPVALVETELHGEQILVPADAEIVLEGSGRRSRPRHVPDARGDLRPGRGAATLQGRGRGDRARERDPLRPRRLRVVAKPGAGAPRAEFAPERCG
jgi:hypothetical protein